ncbi:unnamed protein product [Arabis nemorensis]|uniref:Uncharacterized protein n=1 Tax=Arabis nemorensis TaxID=586526 RepID=A0A565CTT4_9BRAS|nr:unnamed protein product [Arabis nemorensis]
MGAVVDNLEDLINISLTYENPEFLEELDEIERTHLKGKSVMVSTSVPTDSEYESEEKVGDDSEENVRRDGNMDEIREDVGENVHPYNMDEIRVEGGENVHPYNMDDIRAESGENERHENMDKIREDGGENVHPYNMDEIQGEGGENVYPYNMDDIRAEGGENRRHENMDEYGSTLLDEEVGNNDEFGHHLVLENQT